MLPPLQGEACPEDEGSMDLRNVGILTQHNTTQQGVTTKKLDLRRCIQNVQD